VTSQTGGCYCWWEIVPSGSLSFVKRILVRRLPGSIEPRRVGISLAESLHDLVRRALLLSNYTVAFALQLRRSTCEG
jgi:hypothetical protein